MVIFVIFIAVAFVSYLVQSSLRRKFEQYSKVAIPSGLTGRDVAMKMLHENGVYDVTVTSVEGKLTDHYNPANKTVNLSKEVYYGNSVAAAAVAAHECGHALQHATAYSFLRLRSCLVPVVGFASSWMALVLLVGVALINNVPQVLMVGVALFAMTTLFSFVTLPVEIDASRRALKWLQGANIIYGTTQQQAADALKSAAYTYVVAALGSLAMLIYYMIILTGRRD